MDTATQSVAMIDEMAASLVTRVAETERHIWDEPDVLYFTRVTRTAIHSAQVIASKRALSKGYLEGGLFRLYDEGVFTERFSAPVLVAGVIASSGLGFAAARLLALAG